MNRQQFDPRPCDVHWHVARLVSKDEEWVPIVCCTAGFPLELFERAVEQLVHHPEYNSTLILRSETISESSHPFVDLHLDSYRPVHTRLRKLLPRRPDRDVALEQRCTLYASEDTHIPDTLVLSPILPPDSPFPYYHPTVRHLAFRFITPSDSESALLRIEAVPLPNTPLDPNARLYRTALSLLETLHRYGWGAQTHYQKRVQHDCVIPREAYQDLYLVMRQRFKHLVDEWKESTDPLKHVFEDIGIATYLMLLWKQSFSRTEQPSELENANIPDPLWKHWPRPPGGFLDLGCGNGLLTHILVSSGYPGHGIDLRARTSWSHYPKLTRTALRVHALDPTLYYDTSLLNNHDPLDPYIQPGAFLIGNHADELTPWIPLIATLEHASGYLSIPCCAWSFDERFTRASNTRWNGVSVDLGDDSAFLPRLNLGPEGHQSRYATYRIWLAKLSEWMGWQIECDTLRIPSTRNWAILGRTRLDGNDQIYIERALNIVRDVVKRGAFKTRKPEGKAGNH